MKLLFFSSNNKQIGGSCYYILLKLDGLDHLELYK